VKFQRGYPLQGPNRSGIGQNRRFSTDISLYLMPCTAGLVAPQVV